MSDHEQARPATPYHPTRTTPGLGAPAARRSVASGRPAGLRTSGHRRGPGRGAMVVAVALAVVLVACGGDDGASGEQAGRPGRDDEPAEGTATDICAEGPGRTVTELEDVVIPAVEVDDFVVDDVTVGGERVPGFTAPGVVIPEHTVEGGCIVEYDAPGGCLGAVEITGFEIPAVEVPGYEVPDAEVGGSVTEGTVVEAVSVDAVEVEGVRVEEVCQQKPVEGQTYVSSVYRSSLYRPSGYRASLYRTSAYRASICAGDDCTDAVDVPSLEITAVEVPAAEFPAAEIAAYEIGGTEAEVIEGDGETAYLAPADVLFDFDAHDLRADAVPTLQAIADLIAADHPDAAITVEGHTDDEGDTDYNQTLSEQRARAVADWLSGTGGIAADRITTVGYGETAPVAPNANEDGSDNEAGRAANRRVVITVHTG